MLNLLKIDLRRILKDKLFLIVCIIAGVLAIATPLLYKSIDWILIATTESAEDADVLGEFIGVMDATSLFFTSFSPTNNFGLILPILLIIIIFKDTMYGTIRNKITLGYSREKIFLSAFISSTIIICGIMFSHAFLTLGVSAILFNFAPEGMTVSYFLISTFFELLVYIFISALVAFLYSFSKNSGLSIVLNVVFGLVMALIPAALAGVIMFLPEKYEWLAKVLEFICRINVHYSATAYIGMTEKYELKDYLYLICSPLIFSALFVFLGTIIFKKKEIK